MIRAGIFGGTGYTGLELIRLLERHPQAEIAFVTSPSYAGQTLTAVSPQAPPLPLIAPGAADYDGVAVVFLCLPHGAAAGTAAAALDAGVRVIDLSADFRLRQTAVYEQWYQTPHPAPHLLAEAVYGLTELARRQLPDARLVANPGCYPTSILLALHPLLAANAISGTVIADSKSGVSGAGRAPKPHTHFVEVANNFTPYGIGQTHRHWPEIKQGMAQAGQPDMALIFSPHLLPVPRGILSTIYAPLRSEWELTAVRQLYDDAYANEPFLQLLPESELATLAHVVGTNLCALGLTLAGDTLIITSAIDNLGKGAAGQAVQNMNVMFGVGETVGLSPWR